jgi:hypothetical protein
MAEEQKTDGEKVLILQKMMADNRNEARDVDRRYKTVAARLRAAQDLRMEYEEMLHQLERLTGRPNIDVEKVTAGISGKSDEDTGGGPEKEKVRT